MSSKRGNRNILSPALREKLSMLVERMDEDLEHKYVLLQKRADALEQEVQRLKKENLKLHRLLDKSIKTNQKIGNIVFRILKPKTR